jgi:hypothetical protein
MVCRSERRSWGKIKIAAEFYFPIDLSNIQNLSAENFILSITGGQNCNDSLTTPFVILIVLLFLFTNVRSKVPTALQTWYE